ncbi:VOC family protein [Listeria grandensis]|uniref:VOC family protein n=1 Tax=Listeria grandensis TaxID=1494963 RepID=UPI00164E1582|nr:VOC family protein [Listeria grandensis]MBC6314725.1 VOC family protein [Listeria grandensis]
MATQPKMLFVNLAVKDLDKSVEFFTALGFEFNPQFTDENATCMILNENTFIMLLVEKFFQNFTKKEIADSTKTTEAIIAISADDRAGVDEIVEKALAAGGTVSNDKTDEGFMYSWSFQDIDGHLWEVVYMDPSAVNG